MSCRTAPLASVCRHDGLSPTAGSWFADTPAKLGVLPGPDLAVKLAAVVGPAAAAEMSLTDRRVTAGEAFAMGLVNRVVPHESLLATALDLARQIAAGDRGATRQIEATYRRNLEMVQAPAIAATRIGYLGFVDRLRSAACA